jgi:hypothetical protein
MIAKTLIAASAILIGVTSVTLAQSQRNYGPNGPATGDSFGEPYSGSAAAGHRERAASHRYYQSDLGYRRYR